MVMSCNMTSNDKDLLLMKAYEIIVSDPALNKEFIKGIHQLDLIDCHDGWLMERNSNVKKDVSYVFDFSCSVKAVSFMHQYYKDYYPAHISDYFSFYGNHLLNVQSKLSDIVDYRESLMKLYSFSKEYDSHVLENMGDFSIFLDRMSLVNRFIDVCGANMELDTYHIIDIAIDLLMNPDNVGAFNTCLSENCDSQEI